MFSQFIILSLLLQLCAVSVQASQAAHTPSVPPSFSTSSTSQYATHESQLHEIVTDIKERSPEKKITLKRRPEQSHCPRPHAYKATAVQLDISQFDKLLNIEYFNENKQLRDLVPKELRSRVGGEEIPAVADVQALMSMEQLVDALLPLGLMPAVVPEFKGITVGGSLQGLAAESSSFKYGYVHDAIIGFEAVLTDGQVLWCSPKSNADLFYSLPGSFGSLAVCTRVKILCTKALPYVTVTCKQHKNQPNCVDYMGKIQDTAIIGSNNQRSPNFLEGIALNKNQVVSISATFKTKDEIDSEILRSNGKKRVQYCNGWGNKWFFNQVRDCVNSEGRRVKRTNRLNKNKENRENKNSNDNSGSRGEKDESEECIESEFILPLKDYLFRHDQGSFWMASYRIPQIVGRFMGPLLDSTNMFRLATALPWAFPKNTIVLQDFILPRSEVKEFFRVMEEQLDVWPVWLLPMRNVPAESSLFANPKGLNGQHLCNVGAYGIPNKKYKFESSNIKLEKLLYAHNGRKVYYSHSFYPKDFFYNTLYDGIKYFQLRNKYCEDNALPDIYDKIITQNGKL